MNQALDAPGAESAATGLGPAVKSLTGDPELDLEIASAQPASDFPGSVGASAAEELRREMAELTSIADYDVSDEPTRAKSKKDVTPSAAPETARMERFYTGRAYLMFDAELTHEGLESAWDAIEDSSKSGVIVDTRIVSIEDGLQVTGPGKH